MSLISPKPWGEHTEAEMLAHHAAYRALTPEQRKAYIDAMFGIQRPDARADDVPVAIASAPIAPVTPSRAAKPPARVRTAEETARLLAEYDRVQEAWEDAEMRKLARWSVHGGGRAWVPKHRPWPSQTPIPLNPQKVNSK